jgi:hypothetical protein
VPLKVHPKAVPDWPAFFWVRAADSFVENDLVCRRCQGSGLADGTDADLLALPVEEAVCPSCRGSGLLVPRRHVPDGTSELLALAEDGLAWTCVGTDQLAWPLPFVWVLERAEFQIKCDVYIGDEDVMAFMVGGDVVAALFDQTPNARRRLESVFRMACGDYAEMPVFVVPCLDR